MPPRAPTWEPWLKVGHTGWQTWVSSCWGDLTRASRAAEQLLARGWLDMLHQLRSLVPWFVFVERLDAAAPATLKRPASTVITEVPVGGPQ